MGTIIVILMLVVACAIVAAIVEFKVRANQTSELKTIPNFHARHIHAGGWNCAGVAIDPRRHKFAITGIGKPHVFNFDQLMAVEVVRNGSSITKANRGSQVAGAAVGAVLLGPIGLLVGGLSGSTRHEERVKRLSLKLYTNLLVAPVQEIVFFSDKAGAKPDSFAVQNAIKQLDAWYARFLVVVENRRDLKENISEDDGGELDKLEILSEKSPSIRDRAHEQGWFNRVFGE